MWCCRRRLCRTVETLLLTLPTVKDTQLYAKNPKSYPPDSQWHKPGGSPKGPNIRERDAKQDVFITNKVQNWYVYPACHRRRRHYYGKYCFFFVMLSAKTLAGGPEISTRKWCGSKTELKRYTTTGIIKNQNEEYLRSSQLIFCSSG